MPTVQNETEEDVEYAVEEGENTGHFTICVPLASGESKDLKLMNRCFNIFFYRKGSVQDRDREILASKEGVDHDRSLRLYCPAPGRFEVDVISVKAA